jgi:ATP-dependent Clp protease ATP-binding subunit ClpC
VDDVVIFDSLQKEHIFKIIDIELAKLYKRINDLGYKVELSLEAKEFIAEKGWDAAFGARPLKRAIQKYLEDPLAEEIIKARVKEGEIIYIEFDKDSQEIHIGPRKLEAESQET